MDFDALIYVDDGVVHLCMYMYENLDSLFYRAALLMFTQLCSDEALMAPTRVKPFRPDPQKGESRAGYK